MSISREEYKKRELTMTEMHELCMCRELCHKLRFTAHSSCITAAGPCPYFLDASVYVDHEYQVGDLVWEPYQDAAGKSCIRSGTIEGFTWMGNGLDGQQLAVKVQFKDQDDKKGQGKLFQPSQFGKDIFTSKGDALNRDLAISKQIDDDTLLRAKEIIEKYGWTPGMVKKLLEPAFEINNPVNQKGSKMKLYREQDVILAMLSDEYKEAKKNADKRIRRSQAQINHRIETSLSELKGKQ